MTLDTAHATPVGLRAEHLDVIAAADAEYLVSKIRTIPGFPAANITFRDFIPAMGDAKAFAILIDALAKNLPVKPDEFDFIGGLEARGFLTGAPLALKLGKGFIPFRKAGKLPPPIISQEYDLEYGRAALEIEADLVPAGSQVLVVDDLIATGGTAKAAAQIIERAGAVVAGFAFLVELDGLSGRDKLAAYPVSALMGMSA